MNTQHDGITYEFNPAAAIFPLMDEKSYQALKDDIQKNGLLEPIWLYEGKIIDGRNRYNACLDTGTDPKFREWDGNGSLVELVCSLNLNRRHLTTSQKAAVAVDMLPMLEAEALERCRKGGKETHGNQYKSEKVQGLTNSSDPAKDGHKAVSREIAAKNLGIGTSIISEAKRIAKQSPEKLEAIKNGEITVTQARKQINKEEQETKPMTHIDHGIPGYKPVPYSNAKQFSTIAISQLKRIPPDDPSRVEALTDVGDYVDQQLKAG